MNVLRNPLVAAMTALALTGCGGSDGDMSLGESQATVLTLPPAVASAAYYFRPDYPVTSTEARYRAISLPSWAELDPATGVISGTPTAAASGQQFVLEQTLAGQTERFSGSLTIAAAEPYLSRSLTDFYSRDFDGQARSLRNDLNGDLAAEIQFVQSHSVAPDGNYQRNQEDETLSRYMPELTAQRDAMLLFLPHNGVAPEAVSAELLVNGSPVQRLTLNHPNTLPAADNFAAQLSYSNNAWWAIIPWQHVRTGMALNFVSHSSTGEQHGTLAAEAIAVGGATQLVNLSIRVGMLTDPPASNNSHYASNDPVLAASDYFSTLPVSRVVMGNYADIRLDKVMVRSGVIYDDVSSTNGDVYSGDMRENVAKSQISVGINMASYGYTSWHMNQGYSQPFKQVTSHHAQGNYQNGVQHHGLSGGNGIATLYSTAGNEASHEWGHGYGMGHYPGQGLTEDGRWANHHADSGWGYIPFRQRMRTAVSAVNEDGSYSYNRDAMSGGWAGSPLSRYTFYTGFTARHIQNHMETFAIPDHTFASGYKKWNVETGQFEEFVSDRPVPAQVGVAVATILGAHNPDNDDALIYPVFHGNYGNVFELPAPDLNASADTCWVDVSNSSGEHKLVQVAATRHATNSANQLHFNLAAAFRPTLAVMKCRRDGVVSELSRSQFDGQIPALPPVGIAGMEMGHSLLKTREFQEIDQALAGLSTDIRVLPAALAVKINSYAEDELLAALSPISQQVLRDYLARQSALQSTRVLLNHAQQTGLADDQLALRLESHLRQTGLLTQPQLQISATEIHGNGYFFDGREQAENPQSLLLLTAREGVAETERSRWAMDLNGRIHLAAKPWLCLQQSGSRIALADCTDAASQRWSFHDDNERVLKSQSNGRCLDYDRINTILITYNCTANWNQQWQDISRDNNLWLSLLPAAELQQVSRLLLNISE